MVRSGADDDEAREPRRKRRRGDDRYGARLAGSRTLALSGGGDLPLVCMKCGAHEGVARRPSSFSWSPLWVWMLMFCAIGLIARLLLSKTADVAVPLCAPCNARWTAARNVRIATLALLGGAFVFMIRPSDDPRVLPLSIFAGAVTLYVVVALLFVRPRTLRAKRIDDEEVLLSAVHEEAAREIVAAADTEAA